MEDFGTLEPITQADLAELEQDRAQMAAGVYQRPKLRSRLLDTAEPIGERPLMPDLPQPTPRDPASVEVAISSPVTVTLHPNRLDLAAAMRQGRDRIGKAIAAAKQSFEASDARGQEAQIQQRLAEAQERLTQAETALAEAEAEHRAAAAAGEDAGKLWRQVQKAEDVLRQGRSAVNAVEASLHEAVERSQGEKDRLLNAAMAAEREKITARKKELHEQLLAAIRPLLEALHTENEAGWALAQQARTAALRSQQAFTLPV